LEEAGVIVKGSFAGKESRAEGKGQLSFLQGRTKPGTEEGRTSWKDQRADHNHKCLPQDSEKKQRPGGAERKIRDTEGRS